MATKSIINLGFDGIPVVVECSISKGLPNVTIVGLAGKSVDEAKERIRAAIKNTGLDFPRKRIVVNLAPAELPKDTSSLDLAIAVAILQADGQIQGDLSSSIFIGELGLDGTVRSVRGLIGKLLNIGHDEYKAIYLPVMNEEQAKLIDLNNIYPVSCLRELLDHLNQYKPLLPIISDTATTKSYETHQIEPDFNEIFGQETAKRAMVIAAAGGHNVLMSGPPGTGKSMLAKAFIGIMPPLTPKQSLQVTHLHSLATHNFEQTIVDPPLRSPHHTASDIAIIGGGHRLKPGEISLAHYGVLFLDELPEFGRYAIEALRQPLEDGQITVSRALQSVTFPAAFTLIATSNPCPCGFLYSDKECTCLPSQIQRYQKKLSGPILDRIDIHVTVSSVEHKNLLKNCDERMSPTLKNQVIEARDVQHARQGEKLNCRLSNKELKRYAVMSLDTENLLNGAAETLELSPRSYMKVIKVARTIADLEKASTIMPSHIAEALQYRPKTQNY